MGKQKRLEIYRKYAFVCMYMYLYVIKILKAYFYTLIKIQSKSYPY